MNMENDYIDDQTNQLFLNWYELYGINKISEHSRQLRSLLNFKNHIIILRFSLLESTKKSISSFYPKYIELKSEFENISLRIIKFLNQNLNVNSSVENSLQIIIDKATLNNDKFSLSIIEKLKKLLYDLFKAVHLISEQEIKWGFKFLKLVFSVSSEACRVNQFLDIPYALFYEELRKFYIYLEQDLSSLVINEKKIIEKKNKPIRV